MRQDDLIAHRIAWIRREHEKQIEKYAFENGYRAGLDCALMALEGRNILGHSIDPEKPKRKK